MASTNDEPIGQKETRQGKAGRQLLAVVLGALPVYLVLIILQIGGDQQVSLREFILYLTVICPLAIVIALLVLRFLCGESPRALNLRPGRIWSDLLATLVLSLVFIGAKVISNDILYRLFPETGSGESIRNLFSEVAGNPRLFILFVGPLLFLGAASEEIVRVFLLSRLWKVWPSAVGKLLAAVFSACLFGLIHLYQGQASATWTAIFGLIAALYYLRFGRVLPLILAHYLTNALQIVLFAALVK